MSAVRQARLQDARAIGRIEVETWRATYAGMLSERTLLGMTVERQTAYWAGFLRHRAGDVRVAEGDGGTIVGFGNCGPQRDARLGHTGEVYTLYVAPDAQGGGLGRELLLALFSRLVDCGHRSALVWVVRANPSRFFYERLGGRLVLQKSVTVGSEAVPALGFGWPDLRAALTAKTRSGRWAGLPPAP
jgi:ribosomal protein S18 acetylase RimI-like enzyme